jgi:sugar/nucleoside kinase (ribokinase family)
MERTVIGSGIYMLDSIVVRDYPEWPLLRPFTERTVIEEVGGTCGNVMCILSWLGWKAMPEVSLDDSPVGLKIASDLARYGCDLRHVTNTPGGGATVLRCTHKRDAEGNHTIAFRATGPGGSRFPRRHFLRSRDEAPAFLDRLEEVPGVYFFDDPAAGHRLIARTLRERGTLVYFEPSEIESKADLEAVAASDIVKFSGTHVTDLTFTDRFPDKLFIRTLGEDGLQFRLHGGPWIHVDPVPVPDVVDWEGAGDWTSAAFLTQLAAADVPFEKLTDLTVHECLTAAQTIASQSVCFLSSKGLIHDADKTPSGDAFGLLSAKDIRSNFSGEIVTFVSPLPEDAKTGVYSDGVNLLDLTAGFEDDISQMHGILRSGEPINMQDFYSWFGAWEDRERFEKMLFTLLRNR